MPPRTGMLTLQQLRDLISVGRVDTVQLAMTDMQGRSQGKRLSAEYFLDEVAAHRPLPSRRAGPSPSWPSTTIARATPATSISACAGPAASR